MWETLQAFGLYDNWLDEKPKIQEVQKQSQYISPKEELIVSLFLKGTLEKTKWQVSSIVKGFKWRERELIQHMNELQKNLPVWEDMLDDFMQINEIVDTAKNQLWTLKTDIENQKEIPFEILWGQILVQNIDWKWGLKFSKWEKEWKEIWNDEIIYNESTNRYQINIDYKGFPKNLEIEYNGWNIVKIHDTLYNTVDRVQIISKDINVQDITKYWNRKLHIESYQTPREIDIPFRWQRIKLQIIFNK